MLKKEWKEKGFIDEKSVVYVKRRMPLFWLTIIR